MLLNLLKNAAKSTFKGYIHLKVKRAKLLVLRDKKPIGHHDAVLFEVFDTGIGISKANFKNLFTLFGKLEQSETEMNQEGLGFELYIIKQFVNALGGVITVSSQEGVYTRFTFTLPVS